MSRSPLLDASGIVPPFCLDDDDRLKIWELDRTDELFGCRLAGFVAFAIRVFDAIMLLGMDALFPELLVPWPEVVTFSGG